MTRTLFTLATASILALGCGHAAESRGALAPARASTTLTRRPAAKAGVPTPAVGIDAEPAAATATLRAPGDFVVYRFTGSFRATPLTLTERVVARKGSILTIDYTAVEGADRQELR